MGLESVLSVVALLAVLVSAALSGSMLWYSRQKRYRELIEERKKMMEEYEEFQKRFEETRRRIEAKKE